MSDAVLRRLAASNPVPAELVEELSRILRDQRPDLSAPPTREPHRRTLLVAALVAIAALVAGPALALKFGVIDFSAAPPAPAHVVTQFESLSQGAPPGMDPAVHGAETRTVGELGGHTLWVAPTNEGGLCYELAESTGGCDKFGTVPLSVSWGSDSAPRQAPPARSSHARPSRARPNVSPPRSFQRVDGYAHARWADEVEVKLDDGSLAHPRVIWISAPISAGFFYYRAPAGRSIDSVLALRRGEVMTVETLAANASSEPHPFADLSRRQLVAQIQTDDGAAKLWTAPTKTDGRCAWLEFGGHEAAVAPCLPHGYEHQVALGVSVRALGGHSVLAGECGYHGIQFLHRDGTTRTILCADGLVFADLSPADSAGSFRAVDARGRPVAGSSLRVQPGTHG
jgi:hypothetical protein